MLKRLRQLHLYLGTLFAPLIIFFAFSGALQTFNLHEAPRGSSYKPPAWIAALAEVHKNQRTAGGRKSPSSVPLKWFVALMATGLVSTTAIGIYMAFKYNRDRRIVWGLLIIGILLPLILLIK